MPIEQEEVDSLVCRANDLRREIVAKKLAEDRYWKRIREIEACMRMLESKIVASGGDNRATIDLVRQWRMQKEKLSEREAKKPSPASFELQDAWQEKKKEALAAMVGFFGLEDKIPLEDCRG